ncbi:MAG: hypothetical protein ABFR97_09360 [Thermodesulfobacteriota bacterium]
MSLDRCKKCVLPATTTPLNDEGLCPFCAMEIPGPDWRQLEEDFAGIVTSLKGKGGGYDCLVPLNGGKNSSFVFNYMQNSCQTKTLAFTWDNDLIRQGAWDNIRNAVAKTGVDHEVVRYEPDYWQRALRATMKEYERACWCPIFVIASAIPMAMKHKIPAIITGFSEGYRQGNHSFSIGDKEQNLAGIKHFLKVWTKVFEEAIREHEDEETTAKILDHFFGDLQRCVDNHSDPADFPALIPLSNYVNWMDHGANEEILAEGIGWEKPTDIFHSSCRIEPMKGYLEYLTGIDEIHSELSGYIRAGHLSRDQALQELDLLNVHDREPKEVTEFADFLDMEPEEFRAIVKRGPNKIFFLNGVDNGNIPPQEIMKSVAWLFQCQSQAVDYAPKTEG